MFGWLKERFTNAGKLEKAARNATNAANKFGTTNSRNAAKKQALDLEAAAATTKQAVEMAQKNLKSVQDRCSSETDIARKQLAQAQSSHNKVKDTTFQKIKRFATLGRNAWGSRSAAVNVAQKRLRNAATKKREQLQALAAKQKAAMDAEEAALKRRKEIIASALTTANSAANAAKQNVLKNVANFKPSGNASKLNNFLKNGNNTSAKNNNISRPGTPQAGGRGRTHRRR